MSLTVWYISKYVVPPYASRVGSRGFILLREMAKLGHKCALITSDSNHLAKPPSFDGQTLIEDVDGVSTIWLKTRKYLGARSFGRILSWLSFEWKLWCMPKRSIAKPDVIIISSLSLLTILNGIWLRRKYSCKLVFEIRDIWPLLLIELGGFKRSNPIIWLLGQIEALGYRKADLIVGTMPNLTVHVEKVLGLKKRVACIPMGIDEDLIERPEELPTGYLEQYIPKDKFVVCYAGSIGADNALDTLLIAAREFKNNQFIHFLILGDGDYKERYQADCMNLQNITFAPPVSKYSVQSVLTKCDLLYFATHENEMFRYGQSLNKVIDYMLAARPILASYAGYPSMINEAECGTFITANDSKSLCAEILRYVKLTPEERLNMGMSGREWLLDARNYRKLAEDYITLLDELCAA